MGTVPHHQERSQRYLTQARAHIDAAIRNPSVPDDARCAAAAVALRRAASHAVTAAAVHSHRGHRSRRRLSNVLIDLAFQRKIGLAQIRVFQRLHRLAPGPTGAPRSAGKSVTPTRRALRAEYRRVVRLVDALATAIAGQPNPLTLEQAVALAAASPPPPCNAALAPLDYLDDQSHPFDVNCEGCRIHYHGPIPPPGPF